MWTKESDAIKRKLLENTKFPKTRHVTSFALCPSRIDVVEEIWEIAFVPSNPECYSFIEVLENLKGKIEIWVFKAAIQPENKGQQTKESRK